MDAMVYRDDGKYLTETSDQGNSNYLLCFSILFVEMFTRIFLLFSFPALVCVALSLHFLEYRNGSSSCLKKQTVHVSHQGQNHQESNR